MTHAIALTREIGDTELVLALETFARTSNPMAVALVLIADATVRMSLPFLTRVKDYLA